MLPIDEQGAERLGRLQALTDAALGHLELEALLAALLDRTRDLLGADTCAVLLLDEEAGELAARAAVGIEEEVERGVRIPLGRGFAGRIAAERRPVILDDVDHADILNPILREKGIKSMLGVPLLVRGNAIGVLHVGTLVPRKFVGDDVELLELVAARVAIAIERARVHEQVVLLDQLKSTFVAIASHELRTPAAAVYGALATLAARGGELDETTRHELLRSGFEQADRLRRLIEQLLDLSRLDARGVAIEPKPIALASVLAKIASETVPNDTPVRLEVPADLSLVADPAVLDRVVSNLLTNAVRHGKPPIVLAARQSDQEVRIAIEDSGGGVPEEMRARLFDRFERGATSGIGLGLAIARAYARAHGGDVVYDAAAPARFELVVPLD